MLYVYNKKEVLYIPEEDLFEIELIFRSRVKTISKYYFCEHKDLTNDEYHDTMIDYYTKKLNKEK